MNRLLLAALTLGAFSMPALGPALADTPAAEPRDPQARTYDGAYDGLSLSASASTLGLGAEAGERFNDYFGLRINGYKFNFDGHHTFSDLRYDYKAKLGSAGAIFDWYVFGGGFRLSAGGRYNDNKVNAHGVPNGATVEIGGTTYPSAVAGSVDGHADWDKFAPYLGLGYSGDLGAGIQLGFELGAMYHGKANVNLTSNSPFISEADLDDERHDIRHEFNKYQFYPVVGLSLGYHF